MIIPSASQIEITLDLDGTGVAISQPDQEQEEVIFIAWHQIRETVSELQRLLSDHEGNYTGPIRVINNCCTTTDTT